MKNDLNELEPVWRALANPIRRRILDLLRDGPRTTGQLSDYFNEYSRFAVMQHLRILEESGLIHQRKDGRQRFNYRNSVPLHRVYDVWLKPHLRPRSGTRHNVALHQAPPGSHPIPNP